MTHPHAKHRALPKPLSDLRFLIIRLLMQRLLLLMYYVADAEWITLRRHI
jgi:hypothetical protein